MAAVESTLPHCEGSIYFAGYTSVIARLLRWSSTVRTVRGRGRGYLVGIARGS